MHLSLPVAYDAVRSKAEVLMLFIYCFMYVPLFVGALCLSLFHCVLLCVHSSFAIILKKNKKLGALLLLSFRCIVTIICFVALPRGIVGWSAVCDCGIS